MKKTVVISFIAISLALAGLLAFEQVQSGKRKVESQKQMNPELSISGFTLYTLHSAQGPTPIDSDKFLVPELYESAWSTSVVTSPCRTYRGAIVNHHALASDLIVKVMREIARCRPELKTVIIVSPDHYGAGPSSISVHREPYATAGDVVSIDTSATDRLRLSIPKAGESSIHFEREHGVGVLIPFLHRVLPEVKIVPVVVKSSTNGESRKQLSAWLAKESLRGNFILVSADMSHYLDDATAIKNDESTKRALADSDIDFFISTKDAFTDNGPSIAATIDALRPKRWQLMDQAISSDYVGSSGFTTTYLTGFWD